MVEGQHADPGAGERPGERHPRAEVGAVLVPEDDARGARAELDAEQADAVAGAEANNLRALRLRQAVAVLERQGLRRRRGTRGRGGRDEQQGGSGDERDPHGALLPSGALAAG